FFVLDVHGHPAAAVLNGGYPQWLAKGLPTSKTVTKLAPTRFLANIKPERLATKFAVAQAIERGGMTLVDARPYEEFTGQKTRGPRAGHIPTAIHLAGTSNFAKDSDSLCHMKYSSDLEQL